METYILYAKKKNGSYDQIGKSCNTHQQARNKIEKLSKNQYTSYLIVRKSKELGDTSVEMGNIEDLDWER